MFARFPYAPPKLVRPPPLGSFRHPREQQPYNITKEIF